MEAQRSSAVLVPLSAERSPEPSAETSRARSAETSPEPSAETSPERSAETSRGTVGGEVGTEAGDVGTEAGDGVVGSATVDDGVSVAGTGGNAADSGVVVVVVVRTVDSGFAPSTVEAGIVDGTAESVTFVVVDSETSAVASEVDVDGASAISGSVSLGEEADGGSVPTTPDRTTGRC